MALAFRMSLIGNAFKFELSDLILEGTRFTSPNKKNSVRIGEDVNGHGAVEPDFKFSNSAWSSFRETEKALAKVRLPKIYLRNSQTETGRSTSSAQRRKSCASVSQQSAWARKASFLKASYSRYFSRATGSSRRILYEKNGTGAESY